MPFIVFLVAIVLYAAWRLSTRYEYTRKARVVLTWAAAGSLAVSLVFNLVRFPGLNLLYLVLAVMGVFLPVYAAAALLIVELWRKRLQTTYDSNVKALRSQEERALDRITQLQQQIALAEHKRQTLEEVHRERLADQRRIRDFLDNWERGEGLARIRSIKVQEWRDGFIALAAADRETRRVELCDQLAELEPRSGTEREAKDRTDQLRAQLSVLSLLQLGAYLDAPNAELAELERKTDEAKAEKTDRERGLESVRYELAEWERRRNEFLADRIVLDS